MPHGVPKYYIILLGSRVGKIKQTYKRPIACDISNAKMYAAMTARQCMLQCGAAEGGSG